MPRRTLPTSFKKSLVDQHFFEPPQRATSLPHIPEQTFHTKTANEERPEPTIGITESYELYNCTNHARLETRNEAHLSQVARDVETLIRKAGLTALSTNIRSYPPHSGNVGFTCDTLLGESAVTMHTYPMNLPYRTTSTVQVDFSVCNGSEDNAGKIRPLAKLLAEYYGATHFMKSERQHLPLHPTENALPVGKL